MGKRQVSRRYFFGEWHRICPYCGIWFPAEVGSHDSCCSVCKKNIAYCQRNNLNPPQREYSPYVDYDSPDIESELRGEVFIGNLFENCSEETIQALQEGNVEMLLKVKDKNERV